MMLMGQRHFSWIFQIWVINLLLMILIAGGLHWYFYIIKGQDKRLKFDKRDQGKGKLWDFSNQVHDNMFWSLTSGIGQLTIFQSITMWLLANNYSPVNSFSSNPFWFLAFFLLIILFFIIGLLIKVLERQISEEEVVSPPINLILYFAISFLKNLTICCVIL